MLCLDSLIAYIEGLFQNFFLLACLIRIDLFGINADFYINKNKNHVYLNVDIFIVLSCIFQLSSAQLYKKLNYCH